MKNWSVNTRLVIGFGWLIGGMAVGTGAAILALRSMHLAVDEMAQRVVPQLSQARDIQFSVTQADIPMPYAKNLEILAKPSVNRVLEAVKKVLYR